MLIANSDIFFGASLARLGDPSTLDMNAKVSVRAYSGKKFDTIGDVWMYAYLRERRT